MKEVEKLIRKGFVACTYYDDQEEYFDSLSDVLLERGYVKESFKEAIKQREKEFPTGLHAIGGNVSIPHVDAVHVNKEAIIVTFFEQPVDFIAMEDMKTKIPVTIAFMLLLSDGNKHIDCLQELISLFTNPEFQKLKKTSNIFELLEQLNSLSK